MVSQKTLYHQAKKRIERPKRPKLGRCLFVNNVPKTPNRKPKISNQAVSMKPFHQKCQDS